MKTRKQVEKKLLLLKKKAKAYPSSMWTNETNELLKILKSGILK
jgi:hypothetical protein